MLIQKYDVGRCLLALILYKSDMTQAELSSRTGISRSQINAYIKNKQVMSLPVAKTISAALHCGIDDLYDWIPK